MITSCNHLLIILLIIMVDDKRFDLISRRFLMVLRAPCLRFVDKLTIGIINDLHTYRSVFIIFILGFLNLLLTSI